MTKRSTDSPVSPLTVTNSFTWQNPHHATSKLVHRLDETHRASKDVNQAHALLADTRPKSKESSIGSQPDISIFGDFDPVQAAEEFFDFLSGRSYWHIPMSHPATPPPRLDHLRLKARRKTMQVDSVLCATTLPYSIASPSPFCKVEQLRHDLSLRPDFPNLNLAAADVVSQSLVNYPIAATMLSQRLHFFNLLDEFERQLNFSHYQAEQGGSSKGRRDDSQTSLDASKGVPSFCVALPGLHEEVSVAFRSTTNEGARERRLVAISFAEKAQKQSFGRDVGEQVRDHSFVFDSVNAGAEQSLNERQAIQAGQEPLAIKCHKMELSCVPSFGSIMLAMTSDFRHMRIQQVLRVHTASHVKLGWPDLLTTSKLLDLARRGGTLLPSLLAVKHRHKNRVKAKKFEGFRDAMGRFCKSLRLRSRTCSLYPLPTKDGSPQLQATAFDETHLPNRHLRSMPPRLGNEGTSFGTQTASREKLRHGKVFFADSNQASRHVEPYTSPSTSTFSPDDEDTTAAPKTTGFAKQFTKKSFGVASRRSTTEWHNSLRARLRSRMLSMVSDLETYDIGTYLDRRMIQWFDVLHKQSMEVGENGESLQQEMRIISLYLFNIPDPLVFITANSFQTLRILQVLSLTHYFLERSVLPMYLPSPLGKSYFDLLKEEPHTDVVTQSREQAAIKRQSEDFADWNP